MLVGEETEEALVKLIKETERNFVKEIKREIWWCWLERLRDKFGCASCRYKEGDFLVLVGVIDVEIRWC